MREDVRKLAAEFKQFLTTREEDDLIAAASTTAAVPFSDVNAQTETAKPQPLTDTPLLAQDHLTVQFRRQTTKQQQPAQPPVQTTAEVHSAEENNTMSADQKQTVLNQIAAEIEACRRCPLGSTRLHAVPGEGNPNAKLMFIGEGPGFDEDHKGRPFIGRAGQLLDKMIAAMGLKREDVFIANIAKCHPMVNPQTPQSHGNDRPPNAGEIAVCRKYIERQIAAISPQYIVALGGVAAKALISDTASLGALRGSFHTLQLDSVELKKPVKIIATYHPAALLRNPAWKKGAWADLQMVMAAMGLKRPQA